MAQSDFKFSQAASRQQKRLRVWKEEFEQGNLPPEIAQSVMARLTTYSLLISKATGAEAGSPERLEAETRLAGLERELTELFGNRRLMTSKIGVPAIEEAGD